MLESVGASIASLAHPLAILLSARSSAEVRDKALDFLGAFVEFDVLSASISVAGLDRDEILTNAIVANRNMSSKAIERYKQYYFSLTTDAYHNSTLSGLPLPVNCREHSNDEFVVDFLTPQRIRGFVSDILPDPQGSGYIYYVFNSTRFDEKAMTRNTERLTSLHPILESVFSLFAWTSGAGGESWLGPLGGTLSPRETEVARLLASRYTAAEIGSRLGISRRTAETHIEHIYQKLGAKDRGSFLELIGRLG
jgi:DNA-binding CsgD family transcriptional regulator